MFLVCYDFLVILFENEEMMYFFVSVLECLELEIWLLKVVCVKFCVIGFNIFKWVD